MPKLGAKSFAGLYTDPNAGNLPPEAMARADNVVIRRSGVVEPRPGFDTAGMTPPSGYYLRTLFHYDGQMFGWSYKSSGSPTWTLMRGSTTITSVGLAADPTKVQPKQAIAKGNLYFTSSTGVRKLTSVSDNAAELAGLERPRAVGTSVLPGPTAGFLASTKDATYRAVWYKTDPDTGQKYFSPPSIMSWADGAVSARNVTLTWYPPVNASSGDSIQFYRSLQNTTSDDELYLAADIKITSTEINAGTASYLDTTLDADLGASLYSNVSQDGSTQENNMPPIALDLAWFKGSMWFANTESQAKLIMAVQGHGSGAAATIASATEWGIVHNTGVQVQAGAFTLTNITKFNGIEVGQYLSDSAIGPLEEGTYIKELTTVTGWDDVNGYVRMNKSALATAGGSITFTMRRRDWFEVNGNGQPWFAGLLGERSVANRIEAADSDFIAQRITTITNAASAWGVTAWDLGNTSESGEGLSARWLFESQTPGANAFKITSSKAAAFSPHGGATAVTKLVLSTDNIPGRLMWSKQHQQESVPEYNYVDVGDPQKDILRVIPTADALFVFKRDGTFRVTGEGALSGWRVDNFAPDLVLLLAECVCKLDDAIYAWTNRGVVRIDSGGVLKLSGPIEDVLRAPTLAFSLAPAQAGVSYGSGDLVAHPIYQEIWFNLPASASATRGTIYVYSIRNNTWTKFTSPLARALALNEATGLMWLDNSLTSSTSTSVLAERSPTSTYYASDLTRTGINVNSTTATAVNIEPGSGWTPAVGDYFSSGSFNSHVASIVSATRFFCEDDASDSAGTATAYEAYTVAIEPISVNYDPTGTMIVTDGAWWFDELKTCDRVTVGYITDLATTAGSEDVATTNTASDNIPEKLRYFVPTTHQICTEYRPKLTIKQAVCDFRLSAWSVRYDPWEDEEP